MFRRTIRIACAAAAFLISLATSAEVTISKEIGFTNPGKVREAIQAQCAIQTIVPETIAANSNAKLVDGKGSLSLEISDVHAPGGWIFSGPKWVEVKGSFKSGGKTLSFRAKRYSAFNPFSGGTCGILARCARGVGGDIAEWLASPTADAALGDAKNSAK